MRQYLSPQQRSDQTTWFLQRLSGCSIYLVHLLFSCMDFFRTTSSPMAFMTRYVSWVLSLVGRWSASIRSTPDRGEIACGRRDSCRYSDRSNTRSPVRSDPLHFSDELSTCDLSTLTLASCNGHWRVLIWSIERIL